MEKWKLLSPISPLLDFLNAIVYPDISKPIEKVWDGMVNTTVEEVKNRGIKGITDLSNSEQFNRERYGDFKVILIDTEMLSKLLKGEIKTSKELVDLFEIQLIEILG